jgi:1,4-dihydroxy-2-naphthoate octaprenyltransferase
MAARPKTLWAAVAPVLIGFGTAYESGGFHWLAALAALGAAIMIQIGTNIANDYFDYKKGTDQPDRLGPTRVTQAGLVAPERVKRAMMLCFALAFAGGIYLVARGGWPIVVIGLLSIALGIFYTAGPYSLSYTGLADIFVLIFFGPVAVAGTDYVQTLQFSWPVVLAGFAPGLFSTAILTVNNLRDIETDSRANKKSLAVRFGARFARIEFTVCMIAGALWPLWFVYSNGRHPWTLIASMTIIYALPLIKRVYTTNGPALNDVLAGTGKLLLLYAILFSIGWGL